MCEKIRAFISRRRPWVFENSKLPVWLSKMPWINFEVNAFSFGPIVCCRGKISDTTRVHETIHYHQQWELLFLGQWILYAGFWIWGFFKNIKKANRSNLAYYNNPFELEAYDKQREPNYLDHRTLYRWTKYIGI